MHNPEHTLSINPFGTSLHAQGLTLVCSGFFWSRSGSNFRRVFNSSSKTSKLLQTKNLGCNEDDFNFLTDLARKKGWSQGELVAKARKLFEEKEAYGQTGIREIQTESSRNEELQEAREAEVENPIINEQPTDSVLPTRFDFFRQDELKAGQQGYLWIRDKWFGLTEAEQCVKDLRGFIQNKACSYEDKINAEKAIVAIQAVCKLTDEKCQRIRERRERQALPPFPRYYREPRAYRER